MSLTVRALDETDRSRVEEFVRERWGGDTVVGHGEVLRPSEHAGFVAEDGPKPVGLVTYRMDADGDCEIVTIDSLTEGAGIGTALLEAVADEARRRGCRRLWLITTNDNLDALRFYQRRGFRLVALRPGAVHESRTLKPEIPEVGHHGIPIRDELELEVELVPGS